MNEAMPAPKGVHQAAADPALPVEAAVLAQLPPADTRRWVASRKSQVVAAVKEGLLTLEGACQRYQLTAEEFASWERLIERHGTGGLKVTHLKSFRPSVPR